MKKLCIILFLIIVISMGGCMDNSQNALVESLSKDIYQLNSTENTSLSAAGLSNPYVVGVNKDNFENEILYDVSNDATQTVYASDYLVNGEDSLDDSKAFINLVNHLKTLNDDLTLVILPSGDLDFIQGLNTVNLEYGIDLTGLKNVIFSGNDTNIYFYGEIKGVLLENTENIYFRNINFDWGTAPFSMGTILENDGQTFKVQVHDGYKIDENTQIQGFLEYDKFAYIPRVKGNDIYWGVKDIDILEDNIIDITFRTKHSEAPKDTLVVLRHYIYEYDLLFINNSKNIYFENINIYSTPGMGVRAYSSENIYFNRFNTILKEGSDRLMTTTADALHMIDCKGDLVITNSIFENNGDDALNVHGMYLVINSIINSNTLSASNPRGYNFTPNIGDKIEISNPDNMSVAQILTVKSVVENITGFTITFEETFNDSIEIGYLLGNTTRTAHLVFKNNVVRNKRCRGILIQTRSAIVENNVFANLGDAGILITCDSNDWYESISSKNVEIRNNKFIRNNYSQGGSQGDITIISFGKGNSIGQSGIQTDIVIENNFIANSANAGIAINSASEVDVSHNMIFSVGLLPKISSYNSGIYLSNCENINLHKNEVIKNTSNTFSAVYVGQYVKIATVETIENIGFSYNDILGDEFTVLQEVNKTIGNILIDDQSLDDWSNIATKLSILGITDVNQNEVSISENDFKVNDLKLTYKNDGIYFMFNVLDDEMNWIGKESFWNGDGVELFISSNQDSYDPLNTIKLGEDECIQIFMNAEFQEVIELRTSSSIYSNRDQIKLSFWLNAELNGYMGEGYIPFNLIPQIKALIDNGEEVSLNFVFSDADESRDRIQISTTSHPVETHKFVPYYMGKILFKDEDES